MKGNVCKGRSFDFRNKMKNKKYHTVRTVLTSYLKYHTVRIVITSYLKIPHRQNSSNVLSKLKYHTVRTVLTSYLKYHTVRIVITSYLITVLTVWYFR
jgi:hypothetical protein